MKFRKTLWLIAVAALSSILVSSCNLGATPEPTAVPGAIETQAFSIVLTQVAEQQTQTAIAIPPTAMPTVTLFPTPTSFTDAVIPPIGGSIETPFAPIPGFTPLASPVPTLGGAAPTLSTTNGCNDGLYEGESPPYDGFQIKVNDTFEKDWKIRNTGTCPWDEGYSFKINTQWSAGIEALRGGSTSVVITQEKDFIKPGTLVAMKLKLQAPATIGEYKWCWKMQDDSGAAFGPLVCTTFVVVK